MSNRHSTKKPKAVKKALPAVVAAPADVAQVDDEKDEGGRGFTVKQAAFIMAYSEGETAGNASRSAAAAGYGGKNLDQIGAQLLRLPKIITAIDGKLREAIGIRLTVKAVRLAEQIIDDKDAPLKLRGHMAVEVIKFSGLVDRTQAEKADETGFGGKKLAEMSRADLLAVIEKGAALMAAGKPAALIEGVILGKSTGHPTDKA